VLNVKKTLIFVTGLGFGAALTYLFKPTEGNRRKTIREKEARGAGNERNAIDSSVPGVGGDTQHTEGESLPLINGTYLTTIEAIAGNLTAPRPASTARATSLPAKDGEIPSGSFLSTCVWSLQKAKSIYERTSEWPLMRALYGGVVSGGRLIFDLTCRVSFGVCLCTAGLGILTRRSPSCATVLRTKALKDNKFTKREITLVAGFASLALLSRLLLLRFQQVMTPDGVYYATLGKHLVAGNFKEGLSTYYPPLYPLLVGLSSHIFRDVEAGGKMVSAMAGSLLVVPVYLLTRILYGKGAASVGALLIAINPSLNYYSTLLLTESTYTLLFTTAVLMGLTALSAGGVSFFSTGLVLGACYLIRPEAIGYLGLMSVLVFGAKFSSKHLPLRRVLFNVLSLATGFTLLASPYILFLRQRTGRWTISDKLRTLTHSGESLERKWFGLAPQRRTTLADRLYAGIYQEDDRAIGAGAMISSERDLRRAIGHSIEALNWEISYLIHHMIPPHFMALMGLGLFKAEWSKEFYLLLFFVATLIGYAALPDAVEGRLLLPLLPLLLCWVARGIEEVGHWLDRPLERMKFSRAFSLKAGAALRAAGMAALLLSLLPWVAQTFIRGQLNQLVEHKQAGAWIREHSHAAALVMATNPYAAFYAGRKSLYLPAEEYLTVVEHAKRQQVDYLVIDEGVVSRGHWGNNEFSHLRFLLDEQSRHPELKLVYKFDRLPNRKILIFTLTRDFQTIT
jgi:4-amino-4-deoxy-L-arabinose transferase-like glycosyltransferase